MRLLQQRLAETEAQMTKILQAMQSVQSRVGAEQSKGEGVQQGEATQQDKSNNQGEVVENGEKKEEEQGVCVNHLYILRTLVITTVFFTKDFAVNQICWYQET